MQLLYENRCNHLTISKKQNIFRMISSFKTKFRSKQKNMPNTKHTKFLNIRIYLLVKYPIFQNNRNKKIVFIHDKTVVIEL